MIVIFMNMTSNCQGTRPTQQPIAHQISMKFLRFRTALVDRSLFTFELHSKFLSFELH